MTVQNPHDKFFRESFSRVEVARNFLEEYLPVEISEALDLAVLNLQSDSFVDEDLRTHQTDILYETKLKDGSDLSIYLLNTKATPSLKLRYSYCATLFAFGHVRGMMASRSSQSFPLSFITVSAFGV